MKNDISRKKYKKVAPEGGWGYAVLTGMVFGLFCTFNLMTYFGLVFADFFKSVGAETGALALIHGSFFFSVSTFGIFSNYLYKRFSVINVAKFGGFLYALGNFLTIFVTSVNQLLITYGVMQGFAFGIIVSVSFSTFNQYFIKKRLMLMSFAQTLVGVFAMVYPLVVERLLYHFGFRGCIAIIAAVNCHGLLGLLAMHPVAWHMKLEEITDNDIEKEAMLQNDKDKQDALETNENSGSTTSIDKTTTQVLNKNHSTSEYSLSDGVKRIRSLSIASIGTLGILTDFTNDKKHVAHTDENNKSIWQIVVDFLDLTLFKDLVYVNVAIGLAFVLYSDISFLTIQPSYLFSLDFSSKSVAEILSMSFAADLTSRIFLTILTTFIHLRARSIYLAGTIATIFLRVAFVYVHNYWGILIVSIIMGWFRSWIHVPVSLTMAEVLTAERFPSGYGLFMTMQGVLMFTVGPIVGWLRDYFNSFELIFNILTFALLICAVPWVIEIIYVKMKSKKVGKINVSK